MKFKASQNKSRSLHGSLLLALSAAGLASCAEVGDEEGIAVHTRTQNVSVGDIRVELRDESPWENNHVKPRLILRNLGIDALSDFQVHFYFTADTGKTPVLEDWYTPNSEARIEDVGGGLWRLIYDFAGFTLNPGQTTPDEGGSVVGLHYSDWSFWNRADDPSLEGVDDSFDLTDGVVVIDEDGTVVGGSPPEFTLGPIIDSNLGLSYLDSSKNPDHRTGDFRAIKEETGIVVCGTGANKDLERQAERSDDADLNPTTRVIRTSNDIELAKRNDQLGLAFYIQKPYAIDLVGGETADDAVQSWFDAGLRVVQLAYNAEDNARLGASKYGEGPADVGGLTALGREVVGAMLERYMIVDASHMNKESTLEIAALGKAAGRPVTLNHTNALSVFSDWTNRNHEDDELCAVADTGGIIGLMPVGLYVSPSPGSGYRDTRELIEHIEYVRHLDCTPYTGPIDMINHISVASDSGIDGWSSTGDPDEQFYYNPEMSAPDRWLTLAQVLHDEYGYSEPELRKLMGENAERVFVEALPGLREMEVLPATTSFGPGGLAVVTFSWGPSVAQNTSAPKYSLYVYEKMGADWVQIGKQEDLSSLTTKMFLTWGKSYRFFIQARNDQESAPGEGPLWVNSDWNYFTVE